MIIVLMTTVVIFGTLMLYFQSQLKQREVAQQSEQKLPVTLTGNAIAQAPLSQLTAYQELKNCDDVTATDKHTIDDWLLTLQNHELQSQWQQHIGELDVCLHQYAQAYIAYKQALTEVDENLNIFERHELLMDLQREYFSPQLIERWYAQENNWNEHALQRWQILSDKRITTEQKERLISQHISQLPDTERQLIQSSSQLVKLAKSLPEQAPNELITQYGQAAAQRLFAVKEKQVQWQKKLLKFEALRAEILAKAVTPSEQQQEIQKIKQALFDSYERKRLPHALARIQKKQSAY
ncbi:lipase chaperone [Pseudoalteromonas sp. JBTF-M23]|uniref:Lipase chaperone n=1 Tax=Pseudoalteromonas caenipelagi TaxID=2726988 RepID=A0A849VE09_9GAMM|nr:lipase secretion chaperone [Pseudoalteromonas caenipelagi]NOU50174.1 lipase chaperone [Pseudoalteromonas caenipelagi]